MFWHFVKSVVEIYLHNFSFPHRLTNTTWLAETFFRVTLMSEVTCRETTLPMRTHGNCEALQRCFLTLKTDFNANKKTHFCCVGFFGGDALRCFYCIIPCFWGYSAHCFCCRRPRLSCRELPWTRRHPGIHLLKDVWSIHLIFNVDILWWKCPTIQVFHIHSDLV